MTFIDNYIIEKDHEAEMMKAYYTVEYNRKDYGCECNSPEEAVEWFEADMDDKLFQDREYGPWKDTVVVVGYNEDGNEVYRREHTASSYVERDESVNGGRI